MAIRNNLPHLFVKQQFDTSPYTSPKTGRGAQIFTARQKRYLHASNLIKSIDNLKQLRDNIILSQGLDPTNTDKGLFFEVIGFEANPEEKSELLDLEYFDKAALKNPSKELLNLKMVDGKVTATIYIKEEQVEDFQSDISKYGNEDKEPSKAAIKRFDSISAIKMADIKSLWVDTKPFPTNENQEVTWEIWLRKGFFEILQNEAARFKITLSNHHLIFADCEICLITSTIAQLSHIQFIIAPIKSFRHKEETPEFFTNLTPFEQSEWANDLLSRVRLPEKDVSSVCLLDTGVFRSHILLHSSLNEKDTDTFDPTWGSYDSIGHGTKMAGLALFGDLTSILSNIETIELKHRLESVKILPNAGDNLNELYGYITVESCNRAIINSPKRKRVFCLAVSSPYDTRQGQPSAWSSAIDKFAFGKNTGGDYSPNLFVIAVGNASYGNPSMSYPAINEKEGIENPSQAWNAISVGGYTEKTLTEDLTTDSYKLVAPLGGLSPFSKTSISWGTNTKWAIKPDIVCEAGNHISDESGNCSDHEGLSLLTTDKNRPFSYFNATSSATAQAARIAALIQAEYPDLRAETVRGLLVHSAEWNSEMKEGKELGRMLKEQKISLLRKYGYGVPNLEKALHSASNRTNLIIESELTPFEKTKFKELNLHKLPWAKKELEQNYSAKARLKITLSYFIEPNPAERGIPNHAYSYASHGLNFELKGVNESIQSFKKRINKIEKDEIEKDGLDVEDTKSNVNWLLGVQTRNSGCLVSDIWEGTAADLKELDSVAIIPTGGWWYKRNIDECRRKVRYSLIVSLECPEQDIDIYTEIQNIIKVPVFV